MDSYEKAALIGDLLAEVFPQAICALHYTTDFELLFATRLSAQCTDKRVNLVTPALFARFPTLEDYARAEITELEALVKTCGFYHVKARDIKACAGELLHRFGGKVPDNMEDLTSLSGIGRKTANLILGDIYGQPAIVADTHCIRLANRLGLMDTPTKDPYKVELRLKELVAPQSQSDFCHRLVLHGRATCDAKKPLCGACCLAALCPSRGV